MTNMQICGAAEAVISALLVTSMRKATKFLGPNLTVKATRQGKFDRRCRQQTFILTIGKPNYAEREFIKKCRKAGEPLPVKKVQLKSQPQRRKGSR